MGIVRKILGEETPTKEDLLSIQDVVKTDIKNLPKQIKKTEAVKTKKSKKNVEMFVKLDDYNELVFQLKKLSGVIEKVEEIERMQAEIQEIHDQFTEKLETTLTELEEIKEELGSKLDVE